MRQVIQSAIISCAAFFFFTNLPAQDLKYATKNIPAPLRENANSVLREETETLLVKDAGDAIYTDHSVTTILNAKAKHYLNFADHTSKFDKLTDASVSIYDSTGTKIKTYSLKDMTIDNYGGEFVDDGKYYSFAVTPGDYPVTIEINYTEKYTGILGYPAISPQGENQSVENYSMQASVPKAVGLRYKTLNIQDNCVKNESASSTTYTWNIKNLKAKKTDDNAGPSYLYLPKILLAPDQFKMDDYAGDMSTWHGLGKWYEDLISSTNVLSPQEQSFYQALVKDKTTGRQKAETIYRYMQNNMRYVSIQLGIGGWKPFAASFVNTKKYGDCKALVNYMQAALSAVGIKSYPVINYSGELVLPIEKDFPMNAFNHVLLCIPQQTDSIWLECTSTVSGVICSFGELYAETKDHPALMVTDNGGVLVRTPANKPEDNTRLVKTVINMNKDGSAMANVNVSTTGELKFISYNYLYNASEEDRKSYLFDAMRFKQADSLKISMGDKFLNPFQYNLKLGYSQLSDFTSGSKVFIPSRLYEIFREALPEDTSRKQDYYFDYPYQKTDTLELHYPEGYQAETLPENKNFETPYTAYSSSYSANTASRIITVITKFSVNKKAAKASDYNKLSDFAAKVLDDLDEKIVLDKEDE